MTSSDAKLEGDFQDKLKQELFKRGCYSYSQAASMYMSGQPDMMIYNAVGNVFPVENKIWKRVTMPSKAEEVTALLYGAQRNIILHQIWPRGIYCPILAFIPSNPEYVFHAYKTVLTTHKWVELAGYFATLPYSNYKETK